MKRLPNMLRICCWIWFAVSLVLRLQSSSRLLLLCGWSGWCYGVVSHCDCHCCVMLRCSLSVVMRVGLAWPQFACLSLRSLLLASCKLWRLALRWCGRRSL